MPINVTPSTWDEMKVWCNEVAQVLVHFTEMIKVIMEEFPILHGKIDQQQEFINIISDRICHLEGDPVNDVEPLDATPFVADDDDSPFVHAFEERDDIF